MLKISKFTDYGINLLAHFSKEARALSARELSALSSIPLPTVSKLLKQLTRGKFLESKRGTQGGYLLSRPTEEIMVAEIIEHLEGPIALTECSSHSSDCKIKNCPARTHWGKINTTVLQALRHMPVSQMVCGSDPKTKREYK